MKGDRVFSCQPCAWLRAWLCVRFENVFSQRLTTSVLLHFVAVCCSMLQCVAVCCSMLQYVASRCSGAFWKWYSQLFTVSLRYWRQVCCCSILQRVAVRCSILQRVTVCQSAIDDECLIAVYCSVLQYVAVRVSLCYWRRVSCCSILQRVAVRCSILQRVAVRESAIDDDSCVSYGVATVSRIDKIIHLFCTILSLL